MENLSLLNSLNEIEHEKGDEKTVLFVEYRNSPDKLLIEIEELSNWIVERNACQWCTLDGCIELDLENIEDFLRIILAENISRPLSELYKNETNRKTIENFIQIVIETIKENVSPKHDFLRHFNHYGVKFLRKVSQRFNVAKNEIEYLSGHLEKKPHPQPKKEIETFNPEIFKDQRSYDLFLFLVENYATTKQPKQFSQIYRWMIENNNSIKPNKGEKYRQFVKERFAGMPSDFARIEDKKPYEMTTLNELQKQFNSLNKV